MKKPRTKLVSSMDVPAYEADVLSIIDGLSSEDDQVRREFRVGVLNQEGYVYRDVRVSSELELLHFSARMNALGFSQARPDRDGIRSVYIRVFFKRPSANQHGTQLWPDAAPGGAPRGGYLRHPPSNGSQGSHVVFPFNPSAMGT